MQRRTGRSILEISRKEVSLLAAACLLCMALTAASRQAAPAPATQAATAAPAQQQLSDGVSYERKALRTPAGEPWSVHVLRVDRKAKQVQIRAASAAGEMRRELPTEIAKQNVRAGEELLAVVNGDYDIAAPYLGVSDGVSITSEHLWTTGKTTWPAMALRKNGEPLIAVPQMSMELRSTGVQWSIAAVNKPLGSVHAAGPRAYTRDFRTTVKSETPFRAIVVGKLSTTLPLRANQKVRGEVLEFHASVNELAIPENAMVIAERIPGTSAPDVSRTTSRVPLFHLATFRAGEKVELRTNLRFAGRRDVRDVIGGFPIVAQGGKRGIVGEPGLNLRLRHPRTAVCYNAREIIFVVVDGRQPHLSVGMTLEELGDLMVSLGCTEAMNTDGGGSSVMALTMPHAAGATSLTAEVGAEAGRSKDRPLQIANSPSDGKERGRGNAWVIVRMK